MTGADYDEENEEDAALIRRRRLFKGERVGAGDAAVYADPRFGYAAIGRSAANSAEVDALAPQDGAGRPVPLAPSRLHPTRDFFPGQFYRPSVRSFAPASSLVQCSSPRPQYL